MNKNPETISYNIVFLSDLLSEDNIKKGDIIEYKPNDLIFDAISDSWLKMHEDFIKLNFKTTFWNNAPALK